MQNEGKAMENDSEPTTAHPRSQEMSKEFLHWITIARELVADHLASERTEPHNALVINTARTLMLAWAAWSDWSDLIVSA